jgi:hypothetical protein
MTMKGDFVMKDVKQKLLTALVEQLASQALSLQDLSDRVSVLETTVKRGGLEDDFEQQQNEMKAVRDAEKKAAGREVPNRLSKLRELLSQISD